MANSDYTKRNVSGAICPTATLTAAISYLDGTLVMSDYLSPTATALRVGSAAMIDNEIVSILGQSGNTLTIGRGCCDTVPAPHSAGAVIWFFDDYVASDGVLYAGTENLSVKPLPKTASGTVVAITDSPPIGITFGLRFGRPYPPGNVLVNGATWFTPVALGVGNTTMNLTWAHRNRVSQQDTLIAHGAGSITPEAGTAYEVTLFETNNSEVASIAGITGAAWTYGLFDFMAAYGVTTGTKAGYLTLRSTRDNLDSLQGYRVDFTFDTTPPPGYVTVTFSNVQTQAVAGPGTAYNAIFTTGAGIPDPVPSGLTFAFSYSDSFLNGGAGIDSVISYTTPGVMTKEALINQLLSQATADGSMAAAGITFQRNDILGIGIGINGPTGTRFVTAPSADYEQNVTYSFFGVFNNITATVYSTGSAAILADRLRIVRYTYSGVVSVGMVFTVTLGGTAYTYTTVGGDTLVTALTALTALIDASADFAATLTGTAIEVTGGTAAAGFTVGAYSVV